MPNFLTGVVKHSEGTKTYDIMTPIMIDLKSTDIRIKFASIGDTVGNLLSASTVYTAQNFIDLQISPSFNFNEYAKALLMHIHAHVDMYMNKNTVSDERNANDVGYNVNVLSEDEQRDIERHILQDVNSDTLISSMFKNAGMSSKLAAVTEVSMNFLLRNFFAQEMSFSAIFENSMLLDKNFIKNVKETTDAIDIADIQSLYAQLVVIHSYMVNVDKRSPIDNAFLHLKQTNNCIKLANLFTAATTGAQTVSENLSDVMSTLQISKIANRTSCYSYIIQSLDPTHDNQFDIRDVMMAMNFIESTVLSHDTLKPIEAGVVEGLDNFDQATYEYIISKLKKKSSTHDMNYSPTGAQLASAQFLIKELYVHFLMIRCSEAKTGGIASILAGTDGWKAYMRDDVWFPGLLRASKMIDMAVSSLFDVYYYLSRYITKYQEYLVTRCGTQVIDPHMMENYYFLYDTKLNEHSAAGTNSSAADKNYFRELSTLRNHVTNFSFGVEADTVKEIFMSPAGDDFRAREIILVDVTNRAKIAFRPFFNQVVTPIHAYKLKDLPYKEGFNFISEYDGGPVKPISFFTEKVEVLNLTDRGIFNIPFMAVQAPAILRHFKDLNDPVYDSLRDFLTDEIVAHIALSINCLFALNTFGTIQVYTNLRDRQIQYNLPRKAVDAITKWGLSSVEEILKYEDELEPHVVLRLKAFFDPHNLIMYPVTERIVMLPSRRIFEYSYKRPNATNQGRVEFTYAKYPALCSAPTATNFDNDQYIAFINNHFTDHRDGIKEKSPKNFVTNTKTKNGDESDSKIPTTQVDDSSTAV